MRRARRYLLSILAGSVAAGLAVLACGARSGLDSPRHFDAAAFDTDAGDDGFVEVDAFSGFDAFEFDAGKDAFFPVDAIAPVDVHVALDSALACPEGGLPNAYLFDDSSNLYTFDPATGETRLLGQVTCGSPDTIGTPWTLSVSRENDAYLVYEAPWGVFKVDLTTLACTPTPTIVGQLDLNGLFSIAVSRSAGAEKLFIYGEPGAVGPDEMAPGTPPILAQSDLTSFVLTEVGPVLPVPPSGPTGTEGYPLDMQGDPLGNLFGFSATGLLLEIDSATGAVTGQEQTGLDSDVAWAVMSYENDLYLFSDGTVSRYDIATKTVIALGTVAFNVVGASAVPCLRGGNVPPPP